MGIAAVLAQKIGSVMADQTGSSRGAPVLPKRLRVLEPDPKTLAILTDNRFQRHVSIGVNRISRAAHERFGQTAVRGEIQKSPPFGYVLSRVPTHKKPLSGLSLQLDP